MAISSTPIGVGNTSKPTTPSISGVTSNEMNIHNYNKITLHFSDGLVETRPGDGSGAFSRVLTQEGCVYNGQPMWTYADGVYDGDWDINTGKETSVGNSLCEGKSLKLRWGGGPNTQTGNWEVVSHGKVSMYSTAQGDLNLFSIQGSGGTGMGTWHAASTKLGNGGWSSITGSTDLCKSSPMYTSNPQYGCFRDGTRTYLNASLTAVTTDGLNA